ncbi:MAG TPA: ATP-dependent RNA helicase HrpA [Acidimicrobiia bacterium]|nr:ATP-dependent RNA helicase HrpA [Acidimicrobiia bacterium]
MTDDVKGLQRRTAALMLVDRRRLRRRLTALDKVDPPRRRAELMAAIAADIGEAEQRVQLRRAAMPGQVTYPDELPISAHRDELLDRIRNNQVVVVAGETGSGKSTQLPKLCVDLGRGISGFIGHTQPRRIAARSIAERIAEELGSAVGGLVGYTVRFSDQVGEQTLIKLMTDGILLNEIHSDRTLSRYDTIILDEAHERSLNIDFLLGYVKTLLPKRPDLKVIITSATIDTARFAEHFGDAPVIEVSGRTYPVEIRYRPLDDPAASEPRDQPQGITDAVAELVGEGLGDILVFCSGEREIRDAVDAIGELGLRHTEVVPLFGRLSATEQHRIFQPHTGRRIVVATNVAETSLTVPGIRYVIDAGTARISRFNRRTKVQRLPIEPVSQASANQRAGRCGRLGPGICIRLFSADDFASRPEFTEPEIQRTNLASVILQMAALGLGNVESFPFLDPPDRRTVRDGVNLLHELGAIDPAHEGSRRWLTPVGRQLARLPIDPRLGRMLLSAADDGCLREVLVIAAALSIQDPRERPQDQEDRARQLHARFRDPTSDFLGWLRLWEYISEERRSRSSGQFRRMCRDDLLNYKRLREWQDIHRQLRETCRELGLRTNRKPASPDVIHAALLPGLLSHVGKRDPESYEYRGARGSRFHISPGSALFKGAPEWVMAAVLVETNRLWAREVASVAVEWIERSGAHLIRTTHSDPWWDEAQGAAVAKESATLFGIPLASDRQVQYARLDPAGAREMFIRHALVAGEWETHHEFAARNQARFEEVLAIETRERRSDVLVGNEALVAWFDARIPDDVTTARHFDRWWRDTKMSEPNLLDLSLDDLIDPASPPADPAAFPEAWRLGDAVLPLDYEHDPASVTDGVTIEIPAGTLHRLTPSVFDWNVPGVRDELVEALVRSLPKRYRKQFVPIPDTVHRLIERVDPSAGSVVEVVRRELTAMSGVAIPPDALDLAALPAHLRPHFRIRSDDGTLLAEGPDLGELRRALADRIRSTVADAGHPIERSGLTSWDIDQLQRSVEIGSGDHRAKAYPALVDRGDSVAVQLLATPEEQADQMLLGTVRLLLLTMPSPHRLLRPHLTNEAKLLIRSGPYDTVDAWIDDVLCSAVAGVIAASGGLAWDRPSFTALRDAVRNELADAVDRAAATSLRILGTLRRAIGAMEQLVDARYDAAIEDLESQIDQLVYPGFVAAVGVDRLGDVDRYLGAIERRLELLPGDVDGDRGKMRTAQDLEQEFDRLADLLPPSPELSDIPWMIQEFRVSLFAQSLGTRGRVSEQRIRRALQAVALA